MGLGSLFRGGRGMPGDLSNWVAGSLSEDQKKDFEFLYNQYGFSDQQFFKSVNPNSPQYSEQISIFLNNVGFALARDGDAGPAYKAFDLSAAISENEAALSMLALMQVDNGDDDARITATRFVALYERTRAKTKSEAEEFIDSINPYSDDSGDEEMYLMMKKIANGEEVDLS